jgi:transcriptional regulator with GAF, ATPase, and Fis domain
MLALGLEIAECEYLCGNCAEAEAHVSELLSRARTRLDRARIYGMKIVRYEFLSRYREAIAVGREALALFDLSFPILLEECERALSSELAAIQELISDRTIASLAGLPLMTDPEMCMAMHLLASLHTPCYLSADKTLTLVNTAKMVRLSLAYGNLKESALAYVLYGMMLGPIKGDYESAYEFGLLALELNQRLRDPGLRAKILMNFSWAISIWRKPFAESFPFILEAAQLANETGVFAEGTYALFNAVYLTLLSNRDLSGVQVACDENISFLRRVRMDAFEDAPRVILQWARALQGLTAAPTSLTDETFAENSYLRVHKGQSLFEMFCFVPKLALLYTFEEYSEACEFALEAERVIRDYTGTIWDALTVFYHALALAARASASLPLAQPLDGEIAAKLNSLEARLGKWAENCPENFRAQHLIVSAEIARLRGHDGEAIECFAAAFDAACRQECPRELALAHELCLKFWQVRGHSAVASVFLRGAIDHYANWGAVAKVRQLEDKYAGLLSSYAPSSPAKSPIAIKQAETPMQLDFATLAKAARAIAVEIEFDALLEKLIKISIENAGAQRGVFLRENDGDLQIMAEGTADNVSLLDAVPSRSSTSLPHAILQYVRRTGESLVVDDASLDVRFGADPYIAPGGRHSILCIPVIHQGKSAGILYLENDLATHAFTPERVRVLQLLCAQAAISLTNAQLYAEMKQEVAGRRRAETELQRALAEVRELKNRLEAENIYLQEEIRREHNFEEMIGNSPVLMKVLRQIEVVAPMDATVLVLGETGTGKELVVRAIHDRSLRKGRPLVKVNCGAISAGLVESELFGHVKGAFTGALANRDGRFKVADGGTLFLDEVGELPLETQVKLLRVLQDQEFERLGSSVALHVDVRIIAATNRDLAMAIQEKRFREDLFYRLNVFPLIVPPLRERLSDVPLLAMFFLTRFNKKFGRDINRISPETMQRLMNYHWPGNIRELQNVIERAVILCSGSALVLGAEFPAGPKADVQEAQSSNVLSPPIPTSTMDEVTKQHILSVLTQTGGVIEGPKGAAKVLGIHPNTLRSRMQKLGMTRKQG